MTGALALSLLLTTALGALMVQALWPRPLRAADTALVWSLGALAGLGVTAGIFFFASLATERPAYWTIGLEMVGVAALAAWQLRRRGDPCPGDGVTNISLQRVDVVLAGLFGLAAVIAVVGAGRAFQAEPFGGWDGWAIWNLHARFMARGGTGWADTMSAPQLSWTHPDYPPLVPAAVARAWGWAGESAAGSAAVSALFGAATIVLLVAGLAWLRRGTAGLVAGLILITTPFFVLFAPSQHADIPLGAMMLAAAVCGLIAARTPQARGMAFLTGLFAGFASGTKNEGILFAVAFIAVAAILAYPAHRWRQWLLLAAGACLAAIPTLYYKFDLAVTNDLLATPLASRWQQLVEAPRHLLIWSSLWRDGWGFGEWSRAPFLAMLLPFLAWSRRERLTPAARGLLLVGVVVGAGYYVVYLLSPHDLTWHLDTSLVRLLMQGWPTALLTWGLTVPLPASREADAVTTRSTGRRERRTMAATAAAVALAAAGIIVALRSQLAANELARQRGIRIFVADGWHGRERNGAELWAWSAGRATLRVEGAAAARESQVRIRFQLRSLEPRVVEVRHAGDVLWSSRVGDEFVPVEIVVPLSEGVATFEFRTDTPGTPEAPHAGARRLAFAVYRLSVD